MAMPKNAIRTRSGPRNVPTAASSFTSPPPVAPHRYPGSISVRPTTAPRTAPTMPTRPVLVSAIATPIAAAAPVRPFGTRRVRRSMTAAVRLQIETATVVTIAGLGTMRCSPLGSWQQAAGDMRTRLPAALCAVTSLRTRGCADLPGDRVEDRVDVRTGQFNRAVRDQCDERHQQRVLEEVLPRGITPQHAQSIDQIHDAPLGSRRRSELSSDVREDRVDVRAGELHRAIRDERDERDEQRVLEQVLASG